MQTVWLYTLVSVLGVSLVSLVGAFTLAVNAERLKKWLLSLVSFSAGALLADVFIHILPEMAREGWPKNVSLYLLGGVIIFFILERFVLWHHSHSEHDESIHSYTYLSLIGDGLHNFVDGMIIAGAFLVDTTLGLATALAVIFHEIPEEIGNFAVLIHGGLKKSTALFYNFISALTAFLGALLVLIVFKDAGRIPLPILAISASSFIYISMSDLIPQLHKEPNRKSAAWHLVWFILGIFVMWLLLFLE
jgi:zinc and cadmium transporter